MSEIVALLLDDAMPPERLGELLRAARKRRGLKRKQAAAIAHTTKARLREYEQGTKPIPPDVCTRLAECYGTDLSAHVPVRVPPQVADQFLPFRVFRELSIAIVLPVYAIRRQHGGFWYNREEFSKD